jgi:hypothetical protein
MTQPRTGDDWGALAARIGLAAGTFLTAVSFSLFIHTISQLAAPIVCASFIAAGIVGRQRGTTPGGQAIALGSIAGGAVAFVASIALAAAGR